jgi:hypothetical protein
MEIYAGWIASAATMIAAMMTAANLGTRVTGWGFVVFTIGSTAWAMVGVFSGQPSLAITNGFLLIVNMFGVWRWLGKQAAYDDSGAVASKRSRHASVPNLFSVGRMIGTPVKGCDASTFGTIVDMMMDCRTKALIYVVTAEGGIGGVGETLRAISPARLHISASAITCDLSCIEWQAFPAIIDDKWPMVAPEAHDHQAVAPPSTQMSAPVT